MSLTFFPQWPYNKGEWCHVGSRCLGHLGLQQDEEGLQKHGWDHLEIFRYPQALELGKGGTVQASSCGLRVPGRAPHLRGEER